jgi:hypothetical protein
VVRPISTPQILLTEKVVSGERDHFLPTRIIADAHTGVASGLLHSMNQPPVDVLTASDTVATPTPRLVDLLMQELGAPFVHL